MGDNLQLRLDQVLGQFTSVAELARAIGVSDNAIYKWLSGRGQPSVANLVALADAAKVSLEWLATGRETTAKRPNPSPQRRNDGSDEFAYVTRYDAKIPGPKAEILRSEQIVDYLAFKKEWVQTQLNTDPRNLLLVEAVGDSMAPTLKNSDLLLVDLGEPLFRHDGIYVLRSDDELVVKRLQRRPDRTLKIINDNPAYESSVVEDNSVYIIGRVIWAASRM